MSERDGIVLDMLSFRGCSLLAPALPHSNPPSFPPSLPFPHRVRAQVHRPCSTATLARKARHRVSAAELGREGGREGGKGGVEYVSQVTSLRHKSCHRVVIYKSQKERRKASSTPPPSLPPSLPPSSPSLPLSLTSKGPPSTLISPRILARCKRSAALAWDFSLIEAREGGREGGREGR